MRHLRPPRMNPAIDLAPYRGKSAEQLVALVKKHRKTVGAVKELERGRKLLAKHGYTTDLRLGSGQAATVYTLTDYPKYVAKLTHDPLDAAVMAEVQVLGIRPGLPDVVGVADLGNGLYGIIIERLLPLTKAEDALVETLGEQTAFGREADATVWRYYAKKPRQLELLEAAKTVRDLGFTPTDIGAGNVMKRADGSWVVSDLGFSKPSSTVKTRDIKRLSNPRGAHPLRRNPLPVHLRPTRRNPVLDLSGYTVKPASDEERDDAPESLRDIVLGLAPGGIDSDENDPGRDIRDDWALGVLERHDIETENYPLGKGALASVFELVSDPAYVVKVTSDPFDAAVMAEAQFAGPLAGTQGIPKVAAVYTLGKMPKQEDPYGEAGGPVYAIVMERLFPLTEKEKASIGEVSSFTQRGWTLTSDEIKKRLAKVPKGSSGEAWLRGVAFLLANGFRATDLHGNNIMRRKDGTYAISDFGLSFPIKGQRDKSRDIPDFARPIPKRRNTRRRNPDFRGSVTANLRPDTVAVVAFWSPKDSNWLRKQFADMGAARQFFDKVERSPAARYVPSQFYVVGE